MEYLHTMIRVTDLKATIAFFELWALSRRAASTTRRAATRWSFSPRPATPSRRGRPGAAGRAHLQLGPGGLYRRAQFRPSRLSRRRHLRDLRQAQGGRRDDQPPAARRPHGLHPHARQRSRSSSSRRAARCRPPSRGRRCPTPGCGERGRDQAIAALTRLRNRSRK